MQVTTKVVMQISKLTPSRKRPACVMYIAFFVHTTNGHDKDFPPCSLIYSTPLILRLSRCTSTSEKEALARTGNDELAPKFFRFLFLPQLLENPFVYLIPINESVLDVNEDDLQPLQWESLGGHYRRGATATASAPTSAVVAGRNLHAMRHCP